MASRNTGYHSPQSNRYNGDLGKALAAELGILLEEVGKLRDERKQLQYEVAELMAVKSKHGFGGEYQPDWQPPAMPPPAIEAPLPPPAIEDVPQARPGWRVVHKRPERKARTQPKIAAGPGPSSPSPGPAFNPPPIHNVPAWAQWRPNPLLAPTPVAPVVPTSVTPPPRRGLFGASTPPPPGGGGR